MRRARGLRDQPSSAPYAAGGSVESSLEDGVDRGAHFRLRTAPRRRGVAARTTARTRDRRRAASARAASRARERRQSVPSRARRPRCRRVWREQREADASSDTSACSVVQSSNSGRRRATLARPRGAAVTRGGLRATRRSGCCRRGAGDRESRAACRRERGQPQRQTRELDGDGIGVDARQAALGDQPADRSRARDRRRPRRAARPRRQCALVRGGQIVAGGDEKRAAAHRRDRRTRSARMLVGRSACDERRERPAHDEVRQRSAACRTCRSACGGRCAGWTRRSGAEHAGACIDSTRIHDRARARRRRRAARRRGRRSRSPAVRRRRRRVARAVSVCLHRLVLVRAARGTRPAAPAPLQRRRRLARKQPAVERADDQVVDAAAGARQARDRGQPFPEPTPAAWALRVRQRGDGIGVAVDRVPVRYQIARFGEQQEQDAIDDRQRFIEPLAGFPWRESRRATSRSSAPP